MDEINALPDHILANVFGNLSSKIIKSCTLVCKRWDEIIGNSRELMGRFKLNLDKPNNILKEANQIRRKHQTAMISGLAQDSLDVISRHKLLHLRIDYSRKRMKLSTLINVLNSVPSLKVFDVYDAFFDDDISGSNDCKKIQINLKELRCDIEIIHIFECCTVEILEMAWLHPVNDNRKMLAIDFLSRQKKLKVFDLSRDSCYEIFTMPDIFDLKFKLTKFGFDCEGLRFLHYEAFIKFLQQHKKTLTNLSLKFHTEPKFGIELIHKYALENLSNLKHLEMGFQFNEIGTKLSFDELPSATQVTKNIESLTLNALSTDMNENKRFFTMFPNLKTLNIENLDDNEFEVLFCISEINLNVETLQLPNLDGETETEAIIYFPKLKEFSIYGFSYEVNLSAFINRHSKTLEKITIESTDDITHLTTKEILNCTNLKSLELSLDEPNFSVIGMLEEISAKTKPFTLILEIYQTYSKHTFKFPDDKAIWDEEVKQMKKKMYASCCLVQ